MGRGNLFPLDENELVSLYVGGMRKSDIARHFGCTDAVIGTRLEKLGYPVKPPGIESRFRLDESELVRLYESGMTKSALAVHFGCAESALGKRLAKLGYPIAKNRSEAMKIRLERSTPEERAHLVAAAHDAIRGKTRTEENLINNAIGREKAGSFGSIEEKDLFDLLKVRGFIATPQKALWKYCLDLVIGNVAVEVTGRGRKYYSVPALRERIKYILNAGFSIIYVWANTRYPVETGAADYIISKIQQSSSDPTMIGKYWVIRRDGKLLASGSSDDDDFTGIFSLVSGTYSRA